MKTFIQLKDGIGFVCVNTSGETEGIEVPYGTGENYLNKAYINQEWVDAPLISFAEVNNNGSIIEIRRTRFISEVGNNPILTEEVKSNFRWVDGKWLDPEDVKINEGAQDNI